MQRDFLRFIELKQLPENNPREIFQHEIRIGGDRKQLFTVYYCMVTHIVGITQCAAMLAILPVYFPYFKNYISYLTGYGPNDHIKCGLR